MNEKLIVKNFGPIKDAELDLKKLTVFIGPQGSGKSALAKLVAICKNGKFINDSYIGKPFDVYFKNYQVNFFLQKDSYFSLNTKAYNFEFDFSIENIPNLTIKEEKDIFLGKGFPPFTNINLLGIRNAQKGIEERMKRYTTNMNSVLHSYILPILINKMDEITPNVKYLPTDRFLISSISDSILGLLSAEIALQKSTIDFGRDFEIARSSIPNLFIDYLNITYKYENGRNLVFHNETDSVPLSASASGHQSTIPLHLTVEHFAEDGNTHFIIEEPELNLFPTTQKQLIGYLADKCTQNGNELLMTTHSPYVLSAINNLIFAYKVAHEVPEKAEEVAKIIPREQWLNPDDVAAYYVADGTVKSIIAEKFGLIGENELDAISEDIAGERDLLFKILRSKKRETVN